MAEYAGYVAAPNQFDWGKFSSELASNKIAIAENVRAEREKRKAAFEKTTEAAYADIKEPVKGYNETDNDFFTKTTMAAKDFVVNTAKEADYNYANTRALTMKQTNSKNYIASLGETAKGIKANQEKLIDPKFQEAQSDIGRNFSKLYITTSNTSNKRSFFDKDGNGYIQEVDADGKPTSGAKINPILLRSTQGWSDGKIDYDKQLNDFVANQVGEYKKSTLLGSGAVQTNESIEANPLFKDAKAKLVTSLTANDTESARFLTSVGGYVSYVENDLQQKAKLLEQGIAEDKLIPIGLGPDGLPAAKLSVKQRIDATTLADSKIKQRVQVSETLTKPNAPRSAGSGTKPTEGAKARKSALNQAISYAELLQKDPYNGFVLGKLKDAYRSLGTVDVVPLVNKATGELEGYDIFKIDKNGQRVILKGAEAAAPSGAFIRKGGAVQGIFEALNKDQKRGEESIDWGSAVEEYSLSGGDSGRLSAKLPLIKAEGKTNTRKQPAPASNVKIVTLDMVKEQVKKSGKPITQANIDAYTKQLESTGNFKVEKK